MAAPQYLKREQKVRFLASEILLKGAQQTIDDVCNDCRLFPITPAELLEFTVLPVKLGNCRATALFVPVPGFIDVTPEFCQEIGRKSVPFSLGGNWPRNTGSVTPPLPDFAKSKTPSRPVIGESTCCEMRFVDASTPHFSTPHVGVSHVSQCSSGTEPASTHEGITDRKGCVQSNSSYLTLSGSTLSQTHRVDETTAFLSFPHRVTTESTRCRTNCQSVSLVVVRQGGQLGYPEHLQRLETMPSTCGIHKADEVSPALGPIAEGKGSAPPCVRRPKAARKLERRDESPKVEECEAAQNWPRKIASIMPPVPDVGKSETLSRPVIGEFTSCPVPSVDGSTSLVPTPPIGGKKVDEVSPALGPIAAGKGPVLRRSSRLQAAQKLELRDEFPKEKECGAAQNSELSSRTIGSATDKLTKREIKIMGKKRGRDPRDNVGVKGTSVKRKSAKKGLMAPVALKEEIMEGEFRCPGHPHTVLVRWPEVRGLEHSEVVSEKGISMSVTDKSGVSELENPVQVSVLTTARAGPTRDGIKKNLRALPRTPKSARKASTKHGIAKVFTSHSSPGVSLSTPGVTCSPLMRGPGPVVGGAVHLGGTRLSSYCAEKPAGKELEYGENCCKPEQAFGGNFDQPSSSPNLYDGTSCIYENSPGKSGGYERAHLLYVSDSEEISSTAELPQADVKVFTASSMLTSPSGAHDGLPKLSAKRPGVDSKAQDIEMMRRQAVHLDDANSSEVEEAIGPEVVSRAGSRENLAYMNDMLREMNVMYTSSAAEHIESGYSTRLSDFDENNLKVTVPEVQHSAALPPAEFPEDNHGDVVGGGYSLTANKKQTVLRMEHCAKAHVSMDPEYVHHDGDDFAALARESQPVQVEHYQAICNSGEVTMMCLEAGVEITERNVQLHTGASAYGFDTMGATPGAAEERPVSGSNLPKYAYQPLGVSRPATRTNDAEEDEVCGEEPCTSLPVSEVKSPVVHSDHGLVPGVCGGLGTEEVMVDSELVIKGLTLYEAPILEAKRSLGDRYPESSCTMDLVGFSTVSESAVNSMTGKDPCCRNVVSAEDQLKVFSRIEAQTVVSAVPQNGAAWDEDPGTFASPDKSDVAAELKYLQGHQKKALPTLTERALFVPMERSQVVVKECTHVRQKPGGSLESGHLGDKSENAGEMRLVEDAVHIQLENSGKLIPLGIVKETTIEESGSNQNCPAAEKKLLSLELESLINVNTNGTRDRNADSMHPGNNAGTYLRRNSEDHISRELIAVRETVVPTSVKIIDPVPKPKNEEFKIVPEFDNYSVIAEEGSGGYGTVYRVMNNATKRIYAMKCPLLKTNVSCVENEIRVLEKLGGKECIIRFKKVVPGRFRTVSDSVEKLSECKSILLEFMEHDKPEILKKEITVEELRNYSVCLFRALAHMHRLRIMHLDVKPGNFLFSRSRKRGSLVDFNLARDEQDEQKEPKKMKKVLSSSTHISSRIDSSRRSSKRPPVQDGVSTPVSYSKRSRLLMKVSTQLAYGTPSPAKTVPVLQDQSNKLMCHEVSVDAKVSSPRLPDLAPSRSTTPMGALSSPRRTADSPKPENQHGDPGGARQQCEGSAEVQKNQTLGPRLQSGHRALLKYIQTKVYNQQPPVFTPLKSSLPASQRKRVAAVQNKRKAVTAGSVPATEQTSQPLIARKLKPSVKPKGCNNQVKDGPGVGTKGYRAPEVLLRSLKQTTKVDIWSAGVSLLQLVSGRTPFPSTSTDGALRDIAKLRGSDKVLALATRHQRQQSISKELCAMRSSPIPLKEWCEKHSRRADLKGRIPPELFDLLEKCLEVDPATRITAEEALNHQFCSSLNSGS